MRTKQQNQNINRLSDHEILVKIISYMYNSQCSTNNKLGWSFSDIHSYLLPLCRLEHNTLYWHLIHKHIPYLEKAGIITRHRYKTEYIFTLNRNGL